MSPRTPTITFISDEKLHEALHAKQTLLAEAGLPGWCSTQMCFDAEVIEAWLRKERAEGLTLPVHLGVSGVVDKAKLMTMGVRIGLGAPLGYLKKNRAAITKMLTSTSYDPNDFMMPLSNGRSSSASRACTCTRSTRSRRRNSGGPRRSPNSPADPIGRHVPPTGA